MRSLSKPVILGVAMILGATQVGAHHSTAEFNYAKTVVLKGTVKQLQWTNPHSYVQVLVPKAGGGVDQWSIEIGAPAINASMGWRRDSVKSGDEVTLTISPARNGTRYGTLRFLTFADGRRLDGVAVRVKSDANGKAVF
jgi:hypothetical protein